MGVSTVTLPVFALQTDHTAWHLDGAALTADDAGGLTFTFQSPGRARVVLKALAPLRIVNQAGVEARLQPGWDGTLGYSLYGLEVSAPARGTWRVQLAIEPAPVPLTASAFGAALAARPSRFPEAPWGEADAGAFTPGHADDFCAYFAGRGWAVVQPATMDHTLQHPGWTLQGEWTWDAMVTLDYALAQPEIAADRVAVCGLSTGAHLAMNLLALDDRVQAGVVGCILSSWHHYRTRMRIPPHCDCGILGQLGDWLEPCDWAALAAPKPVQFQHGRQDAGFCPGADPAGLLPDWNTAVQPEAEFARLFSEVERAWRLAGAGEAVTLHIHAEGHRVDAAAALTLLE